MAEAIKVAVRVRPFNSREQALGSELCVKMQGTTTTMMHPKNGEKNFTFDFSYWSHTDPSDPQYVGQDKVMSDIGSVILASATNGFNGCLFAYGQTGSGKSYSVLGYAEQPGIIPRSIDEIFAEKKKLDEDPEKELRIWISYLEVYNEHIRDLLHVGAEVVDMKVMDHPKLGVYIPGLTEAACSSPEEVQKLMDFGTKKRVVAATQMNATSSRSHAVFCVKVQHLDGVAPEDGGKDLRKVLSAKINLVDLAGSERQSKTGTQGAQLKEGSAINQSLSALGMVIKELSEASAKGPSKESKVAFRASKLTFLLKDSLAGNSKTYMIAALSPANDNYEETVGTLRFASSVKMIKTVATQNKDKKDEIIENLQKELAALRAQMGGAPLEPGSEHATTSKQLGNMLQNLTMDHDEHLEQAREKDEERKKALQDMSLSSGDLNNMLGVDKSTPYFLNMADDPSLAGCLLYYIEMGKQTKIGSSKENKICLSGIGIPEFLCIVENTDNMALTISKCGTEGRVIVGGRKLDETSRWLLNHGERIFLGRAFALKVTIPNQMHEQSTDSGLLLDGLDDEIAAIEDSPSWCKLQEYLDQIINHMTKEHARALIAQVKLGCQLCDEAGEITAECREEDCISFEVDLTSAVPPTVVVHVLRHADGDGGAFDGQEALYLWSVAEMTERLDRMRDCYHAWQIDGDCRLDSLWDPWHVAHPTDVKARVLELEAKLEEAMHQLYLKSNVVKTQTSKTLMLWQDDQGARMVGLVVTTWRDYCKSMKRRNSAVSSRAAFSPKKPADILKDPQKDKAKRPGNRSSASVAFEEMHEKGRSSIDIPPSASTVSKRTSSKSSTTAVNSKKPVVEMETKAPVEQPDPEWTSVASVEAVAKTSIATSISSSSMVQEVYSAPPTIQETQDRFNGTGGAEATTSNLEVCYKALPAVAVSTTPTSSRGRNRDRERDRDRDLDQRPRSARGGSSYREYEAPIDQGEYMALKRQLEDSWTLCNLLRSRLQEYEAVAVDVSGLVHNVLDIQAYMGLDASGMGIGKVLPVLPQPAPVFMPSPRHQRQASPIATSYTMHPVSARGPPMSARLVYSPLALPSPLQQTTPMPGPWSTSPTLTHSASVVELQSGRVHRTETPVTTSMSCVSISAQNLSFNGAPSPPAYAFGAPVRSVATVPASSLPLSTASSYSLPRRGPSPAPTVGSSTTVSSKTLIDRRSGEQRRRDSFLVPETQGYLVEGTSRIASSVCRPFPVFSTLVGTAA